MEKDVHRINDNLPFVFVVKDDFCIEYYLLTKIIVKNNRMKLLINKILS